MIARTSNPSDIDILARPIPGQSLTDKAGGKPYEKPPSVVSPKQAFDVVSKSLEEPSAYQNIVSLLDAGISSETLASAITLRVVNEIPDDGMQEEDSLNMMEQINPEKFQQKMKATIQEEELDEMLLNLEDPNEGVQEPSRESFLDMEVQ